METLIAIFFFVIFVCGMIGSIKNDIEEMKTQEEEQKKQRKRKEDEKKKQQKLEEERQKQIEIEKQELKRKQQECERNRQIELYNNANDEEKMLLFWEVAHSLKIEQFPFALLNNFSFAKRIRIFEELVSKYTYTKNGFKLKSLAERIWESISEEEKIKAYPKLKNYLENYLSESNKYEYDSISKASLKKREEENNQRLREKETENWSSFTIQQKIAKAKTIRTNTKRYDIYHELVSELWEELDSTKKLNNYKQLNRFLTQEQKASHKASCIEFKRREEWENYSLEEKNNKYRRYVSFLTKEQNQQYKKEMRAKQQERNKEYRVNTKPVYEYFNNNQQCLLIIHNFIKHLENNNDLLSFINCCELYIDKRKTKSYWKDFETSGILWEDIKTFVSVLIKDTDIDYEIAFSAMCINIMTNSLNYVKAKFKSEYEDFGEKLSPTNLNANVRLFVKEISKIVDNNENSIEHEYAIPLLLGNIDVTFDTDITELKEKLEEINNKIARAKERQKEQDKKDKFKQSLLSNSADEYNNAFTIADVDVMDGKQFEEYIARLFTKMGYRAEVTQYTGDQGIDVIAKNDLMTIGIQAKCYSGVVGNSAIQEAVGGKALYNLDKVMVITNNEFTNSAKQLAKANGVILWGRRVLSEKITEYEN